MKKHATPQLHQPREIGLTAVLKTVRIAPKVSGDFASSVMGKYLGTENYRNFFARMVFHMLPEGTEREKAKEKKEVVHHTHVYNRYVRVYQTVQSAPVYRDRYLQGQTEKNENRVHPVLQIIDGHAEIKNVVPVLQREQLQSRNKEIKREKVEKETLQKEIEREQVEKETLQREIEREQIEKEIRQKEIEREQVEKEIRQKEIEREQVEKETLQKEIEREQVEKETLQREIEREQIEKETLQKEIEREQIEKETIKKTGENVIQQLSSQELLLHEASGKSDDEFTGEAIEQSAEYYDSDTQLTYYTLPDGTILTQDGQKTQIKDSEAQASIRQGTQAQSSPEAGIKTQAIERQSAQEQLSGGREEQPLTGQDTASDVGMKRSKAKVAERTLETVDTAGRALETVDTAGRALETVDTAGRALETVDTAGRALETVDTAGRALRTVDTAGRALETVDTAGRGTKVADANDGLEVSNTAEGKGDIKAAALSETEAREPDGQNAAGRGMEYAEAVAELQEIPEDMDANVIEQLALTQAFMSSLKVENGRLKVEDEGEAYYDSDTDLTYHVSPDETEAKSAGQSTVSKENTGLVSDSQNMGVTAGEGTQTGADTGASNVGMDPSKSDAAERALGTVDAAGRGMEYAEAVAELQEIPEDIDANVIEQLALTQAFMSSLQEENGRLKVRSFEDEGTEYYDSDTNLTYYVSPDKTEAEKESDRLDATAGRTQKIKEAVSTVPPATGTPARTQSRELASSEEVSSKIQSHGPASAEASSQLQSRGAVSSEASSQMQSQSTTTVVPLLPEQGESAAARDTSTWTQSDSMTMDKLQEQLQAASTVMAKLQEQSLTGGINAPQPQNDVADDIKDADNRPLRSLARMGAPKEAERMQYSGTAGEAEWAPGFSDEKTDSPLALYANPQTEGDFSAELMESDVIQQLTTTQNITLQVRVANQTTNSSFLDESQEIVQYYDNDANLIYYILPDGTRVEAERSANHSRPAQAERQHGQVPEIKKVGTQTIKSVEQEMRNSSGNTAAKQSEGSPSEYETTVQNVTSPPGYETTVQRVTSPSGHEAAQQRVESSSGHDTTKRASERESGNTNQEPSADSKEDFSTDAWASESLSDRETYGNDPQSRLHTDSDVIGQLTAIQNDRFPMSDGMADNNHTGDLRVVDQYYDSNTNLQYLVLPDGTRVEAKQGALLGDREAGSLRDSSDFVNGVVKEQTVIRSIMHYLRGSSEMRTVYQKLLEYPGIGSVANLSTPDGTEDAVIPYEVTKRVFREENAAIRAEAGKQIAKEASMAQQTNAFAQSTRQNAVRRSRESAIRIIREGRQAQIPRLRLLQKHFYIRQTRDIARVFENGRTDGRKTILWEGSVDAANPTVRTELLRRAGQDRSGKTEWGDTPDLTYEIELYDTTEWIDTPELNHTQRIGHSEDRSTRSGRLVNRLTTENIHEDERLSIRQRRTRMVQRRQDTTEAGGNKEEISRLLKRISAIEEQQEFEENELESAARTVKELQEELIVQKESVERLTQENQRLMTNLKTQEEQGINDQRLVELFDNSGQLDRQRYGMTQLF